MPSLSRLPRPSGSGAYRCRPLLPLSTGVQLRSRSASASRTISATWAHSCSPAGSPGSRSMTRRLGWRGRPLASTVHWCTCSSSEARLASQVRVARSSQIGKRIVPSPLPEREPVVDTSCVRTHDGVPPGAFFSKKLALLHPVRPADPGDRAVLQVREERRRDLRVVVEHLALGRAGARVEHLVEVADGEGAAVDVDLELAHRPTPITGTRAGSRSRTSERMNRRGALTQPAVAPRPLTWRKIPEPRWRTCSTLKSVTIDHSYCRG